jgi:hypothetical protein
MKYIITKKQITIAKIITIAINFSLILLFSASQLLAQDWQPNINAANYDEYHEFNEIEYDDPYSTPMPDEPVRMSNRLANQANQRTLNSKNRVVHAAYNNSNNSKSTNKISLQNYENENNQNPKNTLVQPRKLNSSKTSTAATSAAAKPKTLPKHISRDFDSNFNVNSNLNLDNTLADYDNLPLDNNIIVRRPLRTNTIQVSGINGINETDNPNNYNECNPETNESETIYQDACGTCNEITCDDYCSPMIIKPFGSGILDNLVIFGTTNGFKAGQLDKTSGGNFGFTEGLNWSAPISVQYCTLTTQLGFRAVHSNVNGNFAQTIGYAEKEHRTQYFITAGLFKRSHSSPLQAGVVFDHFEDNLYGKIKLSQIRFELSVRTFSNLEYGFIGGFGLEGDSSPLINYRENRLNNTLANNYRYEIKTQRFYTLFARKHFSIGNTAEFRIGATEYGNVFIAANGEFPITDRIALNGSLATMIPGGKNGWKSETWDMSVGIVIYFRGGAMTKYCNENRPMFDVAQNGSFITRISRE